ncbi:MAG: hypothetical protein ACOYN0_08835 [Phycisphaerales bacterium]
MNMVRELLAKNPWIGWIFAVMFLGLAVFIYFKRSGSDDPYSPDRMVELVTIKFVDTGDEIQIPRGRLDKELRGRGGSLNPEEGIINPKTGKPTGFPFDKDEWSEWIARINKDKTDAGAASQNKVVRPTSPAPPDAAKPVTPPK